MFGLFKNKKLGGYSFLPERAKQLNEERGFILNEYEYNKNIWGKTKKRIIRVFDRFSDVGELIAFYGLKAENCVAVLECPGNYKTCLNEIPKFPNGIAGVFSIHEKNVKVSFPDGISENTVLYNVDVIDKDIDYYFTRNNKLFSEILTKERLIKILFGSEQRKYNKTITNFLASLEVLNSDKLFFYMATKASKEVRDRIYDFEEEYFKFKENSFSINRVFLSVPDCAKGGSFDWVKAEKDAEEGVDIKHFFGHMVYDQIAESNQELKNIIKLEKKKIVFLEDFPGLEEALIESGCIANTGYALGEYSYIAYDRAKYDNYEDPKIRDLSKRAYSVWDSLLKDLESIYTDEKPKKYCGSIIESEKKKANKSTKMFNVIIEEMINGSASSDNEIISLINLKSSKDIKEQLERDTSFSFVLLPFIETQNYELKSEMYKFAAEKFESVLGEEIKTGFIKSTAYEIL